MRRVVVTGMGICSPIGNTLDEVSASLRNGVSGITAAPQFAEWNFPCQIGAFVKDLPDVPVERDIKRVFGEGNLLRFGYYASYMAIQDSGLTAAELETAGIIFGSGGPSTRDQVNAAVQTMKNKEENKRFRVNPFVVLPTMASGAVAVIATAFKIRRMNFAVSAACATSAIAIGEAAEKILLGRADIMLAGGAESADWELAEGFDGMQAMCRDSNDNPTHGSRPFDASRAGFVLGEGAATVVLEELEHAKARGARIYAELVGYGTSSDGKHLTNPDQDGAERSMREALEGFGGRATTLFDVEYLNTHGTSTPAGDANELRAMKSIFGKFPPDFNSTKSLTGHSLGAAGAQEAVYSLLMMRDEFISATDVQTPDPLVEELGLSGHLVRELRTDEPLDCVMSNSFGFGGVNATLIFRSYHE